MVPATVEKFKQPFCEVGMFVHWFPSPPGKDDENKGVASLVTEVGSDGIAILSFSPMNNSARAMSGVRHVSDPNLTNEWHAKFGCWRHLRSNAAIIELLEEMRGGPSKPPEPK